MVSQRIEVAKRAFDFYRGSTEAERTFLQRHEFGKNEGMNLVEST